MVEVEPFPDTQANTLNTESLLSIPILIYLTWSNIFLPLRFYLLGYVPIYFPQVCVINWQNYAILLVCRVTSHGLYFVRFPKPVGTDSGYKSRSNERWWEWDLRRINNARQSAYIIRGKHGFAGKGRLTSSERGIMAAPTGQWGTVEFRGSKSSTSSQSAQKSSSQFSGLAPFQFMA